MTLEKKTFKYFQVLLVVGIPVVIYLYFMQWKTITVYGDDLYIIKSHGQVKSFIEKISIPVMFDKYRPVHGLVIHLLIEFFKKNVTAYYAFNVAVQAINTVLLAFTLNLFLRSFPLSLLFGLTIGLSRFSYFNITQLLNGGALEGLALSFFLATLYFLVSSLLADKYRAEQKRPSLIWSILFANLAMYTHERYIVLLPFIVLMVFVFPGLRLTSRQQAGFTFLSLASIVVNVVLKKVVYGMPFFVGTAGTNITFSPASSISFLKEAILSVFQFNKGPDFLVGIQFSGLPMFDKMLVLILAAGFVAVLITFLLNAARGFALQQVLQKNLFWLSLSLGVLFGLFLIPAVVTIRLEQRWLQASYAIFILMLVIMISSIRFSNGFIRYTVLSLFLVLLLWTDFNYLTRGAYYIYMTNAEQSVSRFTKAIEEKLIRPQTETVFIWDKQRDINTENSINWELSGGYFFDFYQNKSKKLIFIDTGYLKRTRVADSTGLDLNPANAQVLYLDTVIKDLTSDYLLHPSRYTGTGNRHFFPDGKDESFLKKIFISAGDLQGLQTTGFYSNENGIRWTNGNAVVFLPEDYIVKDSLTVVLDTYMPPICKDIQPAVVLVSVDKKEYPTKLVQRQVNKFFFKYRFQDLTAIRQVNILSATIPPAPPDLRVLSFPFVSMYMAK